MTSKKKDQADEVEVSISNMQRVNEETTLKDFKEFRRLTGHSFMRVMAQMQNEGLFPDEEALQGMAWLVKRLDDPSVKFEELELLSMPDLTAILNGGTGPS